MEVDLLQGAMGELYGMMEKLYILIGVVITWVYTFIKNDRPIHLKQVNFIVCDIYFLKNDFENEV